MSTECNKIIYEKGCIYQLYSSQSILYSKDEFITTEDDNFFACVCDEVSFDFNLKAIVRWNLVISFSPWKHIVICFIACFAVSLKNTKVVAANIMSRTERGEIVEISSKWGIRVKDCTELSPTFLMIDQTDFLFLKTNLAIYLYMGDEAKRSPHVLKCFAGSGPERLANLCLLHWFHTKCPYVYRELFFLGCLKTILHYKPYKQKLLQPLLQYIGSVICCSG